MSRLQLVAGLAAILVLVVAAWSFDPFDRRHRAEQRAATAVAEQHVQTQAVRSLDAYVVHNSRLSAAVEETRHEISQLPDASQPMPETYRTLVCDGLERVRERAVCTDD